LGHARQSDAVTCELLSDLSGGSESRRRHLTIKLDPTMYERYGLAKEAACHHKHVYHGRGYHPCS
jgi:hypothetical protein